MPVLFCTVCTLRQLAFLWHTGETNTLGGIPTGITLTTFAIPRNTQTTWSYLLLYAKCRDKYMFWNGILNWSQILQPIIENAKTRQDFKIIQDNDFHTAHQLMKMNPEYLWRTNTELCSGRI